MNRLPIDASFILPFLMVCLYATNRFNTPPTVRSQTSRFQYASSCVFYVISSVGLFILVTWLLWKSAGTRLPVLWRIRIATT